MDLDVYEILQISASANEKEIKKQYRKLALQHHPDKGGDEDKFNEIARAFEIVTNADLLTQYKQLREQIYAKKVQEQQWDDSTRKFHQQLQRAEREHAANRQQMMENDAAKFERELAEQTLKRRRLAADHVYTYTPWTEIPVEPFVNECQVEVYWKNREGVVFDEKVVGEIMGVFGNVEGVELRGLHSNGYNYAVVTFTTATAAKEARSHDYRRSASKWDGSSHRKSASLLRECTRAIPW